MKYIDKNNTTQNINPKNMLKSKFSSGTLVFLQVEKNLTVQIALSYYHQHILDHAM